MVDPKLKRLLNELEDSIGIVMNRQVTISAEEFWMIRDHILGKKPPTPDCIHCKSSDTVYNHSGGDGFQCSWDVYDCRTCGKSFEIGN